MVVTLVSEILTVAPEQSPLLAAWHKSILERHRCELVSQPLCVLLLHAWKTVALMWKSDILVLGPVASMTAISVRFP